MNHAHLSKGFNFLLDKNNFYGLLQVDEKSYKSFIF